MAVVVHHALLQGQAGAQVTHVHDHRCAHANAERRRDPTRTTTIRRSFEREVNRRFRELIRLVRVAIVERDVLGLQDPPSALAANADQPRRFGRTNAVAPPPVRAFQFERSGGKVAAFMDWLNEAAYDGLLGITLGTSLRSAAQSAWSNVYVTSAYQRGVQSSVSRMRRAGVTVADRWIDAALRRPIHVDRVGLMYTRVFEELVGVTDEMSRQMSRTLALAIADGVGATETARRLVDRVEKIGRTRARMIARTETIAAHAEASLNSYEEAAIEGVQVEAEFTTAGDDQVCPECQALEGRTYSIEEARGVIPVHPNCRCAFVPVVSAPRGKVLD